MRVWRIVFIALLAAWLGPLAQAAITCDVVINDPGKKYAEYEARLRECIQAAATEWGQALDGDARLNIIVRFDPAVKNIRGASILHTPTRTLGIYKVYEQGALTKLRSNATKPDLMPDAEIVLAPNFLTTQLWFDPEPDKRTAEVPADRVDAISVFSNEFGHILAFHTWLATDADSNKAISTFDLHVTKGAVVERELFFVGPKTLATYGQPVPLDSEKVAQVGMAVPGMGADLSQELMGGVATKMGRRFRMTPLTLAMLSDMGVPLRGEGRTAAQTERPMALADTPTTAPNLAAAESPPVAPMASPQVSLLAVGLNMGGMILVVLAVGMMMGVLGGRWWRYRKSLVE